MLKEKNKYKLVSTENKVMTAIAVLAGKYNEYRPVLIERSRNKDVEILEETKKHILDITEVVEKIELLNQETFAMFNNSELEENKISKTNSYLLELENKAQIVLKSYKDFIHKFGNNELYEMIIEKYSPNLFLRIANIIDDLEDILGNINIALQCSKEIAEIDELAEEYIQKAPVIGLDKLCE